MKERQPDMTGNVTYLRTGKHKAMEDLGIAIATLDIVISQMLEAGLQQEADVLERAMKDIWRIGRQRYAHQLAGSLESEGKELDEDDHAFIETVCTASPEGVKKMLEIIANAEKIEL